VLDYWITHHFKFAFAYQDKLLTKLAHFLDFKILKDFPQMASRLKTILQKQLSNMSDDKLIVENEPESIDPPPSMIPKHLNNRELLLDFLNSSPKALYELDPIEIARQLTLLESKLFKSIRSEELLNEIWKEKNIFLFVEEEDGRHLNNMVEHTNCVSIN
jgi:hypothetical protein